MTPAAVDDWRAVLDGRRAWAMVNADCHALRAELPAGAIDAVITDPPYGMKANLDSRRYGNAASPLKFGKGKSDWPAIIGDDGPFDPAPWVDFPRVVLFGYHHFAQALPRGTVLVWIKRSDALFGTFMSDAELAWSKGGHGVYCYRKQFRALSRIAESGIGKALHPTQKPVGLMSWAMDRAKVPADAVVLDPYAGSGSTGSRKISALSA